MNSLSKQPGTAIFPGEPAGAPLVRGLLPNEGTKVNKCRALFGPRSIALKKRCRLLILIGLSLAAGSTGRSQNLVTNPGGELSPAGKGWTLLSAGVNACAAGTAAATYSNWTMAPDGSANYPAAHGGTKTFFAGCNTTVPAGPFELYQDIDVTSDAAQIDAGFESFSFSGYIQTPISPQGDAGRFIVDYLGAGGTVLGTSYSSAYQSFSGGSGAAWTPYANTRAAAVGTRTIRIRMQATISTGPAINAYFDDISLTRLTALPLGLTAFTARDSAGKASLRWSVATGAELGGFEVQKSTDAIHFADAGSVVFAKGQTDYYFADPDARPTPLSFYRLKIFGLDSTYYFSSVAELRSTAAAQVLLSPNPAYGEVTLSGLAGSSTVTVRAIDGSTVLRAFTKGTSATLGISRLGKGIYIVVVQSGSGSSAQKLFVR